MTDVNVRSVDVEFTLPEDKIPELQRTLDAAARLHLEGLPKDVPSALTAEFRDLRANDLRGPDGFQPFNAMQHMQKLDQIQQSIAARAYQREQLKRYGEHFAALNPPKMAKWPSAISGPVPVPNPCALPFPYAGVEGVLTPRYKPPPQRKRKHLELEEDDWEDLNQLGRRVTPVGPVLLFAKDGFDMNLQCLQTDIYRMEAGIKELGRAADIQKLEREMHEFTRDRRVPLAVSRRLFDVELTVQEKQRLLEELQWNKRLEEEHLFWVERTNRNRYYHELYSGKLEGELKNQMTSKHPTELDDAKVEAERQYIKKDFFDDLRRGRASFDVEMTRILVSVSPSASEADKHAYKSVSGLYEWMGSYGTKKRGMVFIKQGDKKGRPRIQYSASEDRWIITREDGSVICRSAAEDRALKSPTEATWTDPDLIVAYQSDEVTLTKRGAGVAFDLGSAYAQPALPSRGRQRTNLAQYEEWLLNQQISKDKALEAELAEAARRDDLEEYEEEIESDQDSEEEVIFDDDEAFHAILTRSQKISAAEASKIDVVLPTEEGYLESTFNYLYDVVMGDEDKAETEAILYEENVVKSYAALDLPKKRRQYGFDPSAFWEHWQVKELDPAKVYDGTALCRALIARHRRGNIGAHGGQDGAQAVFEFLWAASKEKVGGAEGMRRIGLISDILHKYPYKAFPIYYWAIETMVFLYHQQQPMYQRQFARPIFDICGYVARVTFDAPCFSVHTRLLAAMAMSISDTSVVTGTHVAFVLRRYNERRTRLKGNLLSISIEYILQFIMVAQSPRLIRSQVALLAEVMESFKFNAKLAVRGLLCFVSLYELGDSRPANGEEEEKGLFDIFLNRNPKQSIIDKLILPESAHIRNVVDICDLYTDDRKVQGAGCKALVAAAALNEEQVREVVHYGGLRAILYAAKRYPVSSAVSLALAEMYHLAAKTAPEELVTEHLFKACTNLMVNHANEPKVVQTCAKAMALSHVIIRRAVFSEIQQEISWKNQTLSQFLLVAERHLYDAKTAGEVLKLLRVLAQDDVRLFSSGRSPTAALCMKAVEECQAVIPIALEIYNRLMHDRNTFDVDIVRKCDSLKRIIQVFTTLGPEKSLTAEQTRWLMLTIGNIALCDTQSVEALWREMSPRLVWAHLKTAILRVNVEDSDVVAQSSRAMTLLLNIEDPLGRDEPPPLTEKRENRTAEATSRTSNRTGGTTSVVGNGLQRQRSQGEASAVTNTVMSKNEDTPLVSNGSGLL